MQPALSPTRQSRWIIRSSCLSRTTLFLLMFQFHAAKSLAHPWDRPGIFKATSATELIRAFLCRTVFPTLASPRYQHIHLFFNVFPCFSTERATALSCQIQPPPQRTVIQKYHSPLSLFVRITLPICILNSPLNHSRCRSTRAHQGHIPEHVSRTRN